MRTAQQPPARVCLAAPRDLGRSSSRSNMPRRGRPQHGCTTLSAVSPWNRKAGDRLTSPLSERARYIQRLDYDKRERLVEWAVIQSRLTNGGWQHVAVYDICHGKGVHVHLFNRREEEFTEVRLRSVTSYKDVEDGLDYVVDRVLECWQENERRSDRGY
jgi:hypothetical protein